MIDFTLGFSLWRLLSRAGASDSEYVIFGSTVMYLHGLRERETVSDCDVFVSRRVWGALLADSGDDPGVTVETPRAGDPPYLVYRAKTPIHFFYDWTARDAAWMNVEECFDSAELVLGKYLVGGRPRAYQCISLELLRRHKALAHSHNLESAEHEKHQRDLAVLDTALSL